MHYKSNPIFLKCLAPRLDDPNQQHRDRLRTQYELFWQRGLSIARQIANDFSGLTLYDEYHLSAVWDRAAQLTGENYDINPLECFVFGAVVIIHDIGHALSTYEGGVSALKEGLVFKDNLAKVIIDDSEDINFLVDLNKATEDQIKKAIFVTARQLHADQAPRIVSSPLYHTGQFLLDDEDLRKDLGDIIGKIAASHSWSLGRIEQEISKVQGAPGYLPEKWQINPWKIACLLRCADAIQIDQRRAPHFQFAIHNPSGVSRDHWLAQQLPQPVIDDRGPPPFQLIFTSQRPFLLNEADAWWVTYDLIAVADKELGDCYQFMKDKQLPIFTVDRIAGAGSAERLAKFIRPDGWTPVKAEVKVSDIDHIVKLFGGFGLYGYDVSVPIREMIQNASDAIRARHRYRRDDAYVGRISISVTKPDEDDFRIISIEDNGVGMSQRVMTGPLLEFGKSFWKSDDIKKEFPGLISSGLTQIGRYGIGFFSSFMVSRDIKVTSVDCRAYRGSAASIIFRDALKLRPLLAPLAEELQPWVSTKIDLKIPKGKIEDILVVIDRLEREKTTIELKDFIAHLCPALDCDVFTKFEDGPVQLAHSAKWYEDDAERWLDAVLLNNCRAQSKEREYIRSRASSLSIISELNGVPCGRATISTLYGHFGLDNIGGFAGGMHARSLGSMSELYLGSLRREPDGPRRGAGALSPSKEAVSRWASEQAEIIAAQGIPQGNQYVAAANICAFGGDSLPLASAVLNKEIVSLSTVVELLMTGQDIYCPASSEHLRDDTIYVGRMSLRLNAYSSTHLRGDEIDLKCNMMESLYYGTDRNKSYHFVELDESKKQAVGSIMDCLQRLCALRNKILKTCLIDDFLFGIYVGESSTRERIETGQELRDRAVKFTLAA